MKQYVYVFLLFISLSSCSTDEVIETEKQQFYGVFKNVGELFFEGTQGVQLQENEKKTRNNITCIG